MISRRKLFTTFLVAPVIAAVADYGWQSRGPWFNPIVDTLPEPFAPIHANGTDMIHYLLDAHQKNISKMINNPNFLFSEMKGEE